MTGRTMTGGAVQRALFLAVTAILVVSVIAGTWMRRVVVDSWIGYLPREHQLFVVTGGIGELWASIDDHFGDAMRDTERMGWLASFITTLDEPFSEGGVPVRSVDDLERYGFDVTRGAAWSVGAPNRAEPDAFFVFPVADRVRFRDWFGKLQDSEPVVEVVEGSDGPVDMLRFHADAWLAFPEPGVAIVTSSPELLERSVTQHADALRWWRNNDALVDALTTLSASRGGKALLHWAHEAPPVRSLTAVLRFGADTVNLDVTARLMRGGLQIVDDVLQRQPVAASLDAAMPGDVAGTLVLDDAAISRYLRFAGRFVEAGRFIETGYGGLLGTLRDTAGLERVAVALTGYRDGLPEIVLVLDGDRAVLEGVVRRQQRRLALERDRGVLEGALASWADAGGDVREATVEELESRGLLEPEPALRGYRFDVTPDTVTIEGEPADERFASADYRSGEVRFLYPPRNANDVRYLLAVEPDGEAPVDTETFLDDRYRMATWVSGGRLWVATDAAAYDVASEGGDARDTRLWEPLLPATGEGKLRAGVDVDRLVELGLLTPEPDVQEWVRHYLLDLAGHPAAALELRTRPFRGTVEIELTLARGAALGRTR